MSQSLDMDLTVCLVVNEKKFSHVVTLSLTGQYPMSNYAQCLSYFHILEHVQGSSGLNHYFFELTCTQSHGQTKTHQARQTDTHTDTQMT